jgi:hypothetical protein
MMPRCYYKNCRKVAEINIGKVNAKDGDVEGGCWMTSVYLCKKHAKKIADQLCFELCGEEEE